MNAEQQDLDEMLVGFLEDSYETVRYKEVDYKALIDRGANEKFMLDAGYDPRSEMTVLIRESDFINGADPTEHEIMTVDNVAYKITSVTLLQYARSITLSRHD